MTRTPMHEPPPQKTPEPSQSPQPIPGSQGPTAAGPRRRGACRRSPLGFLALLLGQVWRLLVRLLLLFLLLLGLVLGTQTGLRVALGLAEDLAPGVVSLGEVDGRVLGALHIRKLALHLPGLDLSVDRFDLDWSPLGALGGTLRIGLLAADGVSLVTAPSEKEQEPLRLPEIALPLRIALDEARVTNLRLSQRGAAAPLFRLDRAVLAARFDGSELTLDRLEVALPEPMLTAQAAGHARLAEGYPLGVELGWQLKLPGGAELSGEGRIGGDLERLSVDHRFGGAVRAELSAHVEDVLSAPGWNGQLRLLGVDLPALAPGAPPVELAGRLASEGDLETAALAGTLEGRAPGLADFGQLKADLAATWKDKRLVLDALKLTESDSGAELAAAGALDLKQAIPAFDLEASWERLRWPLTGNRLVESPRGKVAASGTLDDYVYGLTALVEGPAAPTADIDLAGTGNLTGIEIARLAVEPQAARAPAEGVRPARLSVATLGGRIEAEGRVTWAPEVTWDLKIEGRDLDPEPFLGVADRIGFRLDTQGSLDRYTYDLAATTRGPGLPAARLALGGAGDLAGTEIDTLRFTALDGRIEGRARVGWRPKVVWDAELVAESLDPGSYAPAWPGRIGGRIATQGSLEPDGPRLVLTLDGVAGALRGYPVAAAGQVRMEGGDLRIEDLRASSGPTVARVDGTVADGRLDLTLKVESPDLQTLLPDARGRVQVAGDIAGTLKAPKIDLTLSAADLQVAGQGVGRLDGRLDLALTPEGPFDIRLDGQDLAAGGVRFATLAVRGEGDMGRHTLTAAVAGDTLSADLAANGSLAADRTYQGTVERLELAADPWGRWRLQRPMPLSLAGERMAAGPLCLRNAQGSGGCVELAQSRAGRWNARIDLDQLGAELVEGFLPDNLDAQGAAQIEGRFEANGPLLDGSAVARIPEGRLTVAVGRDRQETLDLSGTRLTLSSGAQGLNADLSVPVAGLGGADARLALPGWRLDAPARPGQALQGQAKLKLEHLDFVADLVPDLTDPTGSIAADLTLGGTLASPDVRGRAAARGIGAQVPLIGLEVSDTDLTARVAGNRIDLEGQATVGGGRVGIAGDYRFGPGGGSGVVRAAGEKLKVADTSQFFVVVTPRFEVRLDPKSIQVTGEVLVPEARIRPRTLPAGAVRPSPDVVLASRAGEEKPPVPLSLDVRLKLGEAVTIDAFGVRGRLVGDLAVLKAPDRDQILGDGQLGIVDGVYRMSAGFGLSAEIGVPLTIEQGRLVYAKSPIDNPGLLLKVRREGGDATAGVSVTGTLRDPKLAFFSESDPGLTQAEITTYLLTGQLPGGGSGSENRSLSVGTYLSPKLYMEYQSGLGNQPNEVILRYQLNRHIELQTETGESQGGDIFWSFEN